jgi:hypothetical protein
MTDVIELARRIVSDNTCVIEGNYRELQEAWGMISQWRMSEECKERKIDYDWIRMLNAAEYAIKDRIHSYHP